MADDLEVTLPCDSTSAAVAREAVATLLASRLPSALMGDVLIVVSELVTNAVQHTGDDCTLVVQYRDDCVVIEVSDSDAWKRPSAAEARRDDDLGRGLGAVQTLTSRWGIERTPSGKTVWAELALSDQDRSTVT